jgi:anaerobic carbon-monoxide dehydrogenase iron sulfur subunit
MKYLQNDMKYLKPVEAMCRNARDCERVCAKTFYKTDDTSYSAIKVSARPDGTMQINVCNQCGVCIDVCPVMALKRNKLGVVMVDKKTCIGCFQCVGFCPENAMFQHPELNYPIKCVACGQCVKACPHKALEISMSNLSAEAKETTTLFE